MSRDFTALGLNTAEAVDNVILYITYQDVKYLCLNTAEAVDNVIKMALLSKVQNCLNTAEAVDNVITLITNVFQIRFKILVKPKYLYFSIDYILFTKTSQMYS